MRDRVFTVLIGNELHEVKADSPAQAAVKGANIHRSARAARLEPELLFVETVVFLGTAPQCIYNCEGIYAV